MTKLHTLTQEQRQRVKLWSLANNSDPFAASVAYSQYRNGIANSHPDRHRRSPDFNAEASQIMVPIVLSDGEEHDVPKTIYKNLIRP